VVFGYIAAMTTQAAEEDPNDTTTSEGEPADSPNDSPDAGGDPLEPDLPDPAPEFEPDDEPDADQRPPGLPGQDTVE
jgi:hypothetical protein